MYTVKFCRCWTTSQGLWQRRPQVKAARIGKYKKVGGDLG